MMLRIFGLLVVAQTLSVQPVPPSGWYQTDDGLELLISPGPTGGTRLFNFDSLQFHPLVPDSTSNLRLAGQGNWKGGALRVSDNGQRLELTLPTGAIRHFRRHRQPPFALQEVHFRNDSVRLAGLLLVPASTGNKTFPGVVLIHGSGDSDRDNIWAFTFAQHLARSGIAVLFPDKRGSGASGGNWQSADFSDLARDALAGREFLRRTTAIDANRVGLVGLSQGGWIAPRAAELDRSVPFVVSVSAAAVTPSEQLRHEIRQDMLRAGDNLADRRAADSLIVLSMNFSRSQADPDFFAYIAFRDALIKAGNTALVEPFTADRNHWRLAWWGRVADFDPVRALDASRTHALFVYGSRDEQDNVPVAESVGRLDSLRRAGRPVTVNVFPGIGHTLIAESTGWVSLDALGSITKWIADTRQRPRNPE